MALSKDWRTFLELLNSRGVDYVIVGAQSPAFHGRRNYNHFFTRGQSSRTFAFKSWQR